MRSERACRRRGWMTRQKRSSLGSPRPEGTCRDQPTKPTPVSHQSMARGNRSTQVRLIMRFEAQPVTSTFPSLSSFPSMRSADTSYASPRPHLSFAHDALLQAKLSLMPVPATPSTNGQNASPYFESVNEAFFHSSTWANSRVRCLFQALGFSMTKSDRRQSLITKISACSSLNSGTPNHTWPDASTSSLGC